MFSKGYIVYDYLILSFHRVDRHDPYMIGHYTGWEWTGPDLALDLAPIASRPILWAMGRPSSKNAAASLARWFNGADPDSGPG
jgi:hypothetical protein